MKIDVRGRDLEAFRAISNGKYNLGSVILAGADGLSKVNNHRILRNSHANSPAENRAVRMALYQAICSDSHDHPLDEKCLTAIRAKLGLDKPGNAVGSEALTRRDIKQILAFTEQGRTSVAIFSAARERVKEMIARQTIPDEEKTVLEANLLSDNGKLANWQRTFDTRLVSTLRHINPQTAPTADAIGDQTSRLDANIRTTCQNFIQSFVSFSKTAREQIAAKTGELRNAVNARIEDSELNRLKQNDDERRTTKALFAELKNIPEKTAHLLESRLLVRLAGLTFDDVTGKDAGEAARTFVNGLMPAQNDLLARVDNRLALQAREINTRLRNEALEAKQAVDSGRAAIEAKMAETDRQFAAFQKHIDLLESSFSGLAEQHPRADERLDGDTIRAALRELRDAFNRVLEEKTALAERVSRESATLEADNVRARQRQVSETCGRLVTEARKALDAKIEELNGKLKLTVVPKLGEDPSVAETATKEKRAEFTRTLEAEWDDASNRFTERLDGLLNMATDYFAGLKPGQRRPFDEILNGIKARFGAENRKAFVEGHGVRDAKPEHILAKAMLDALKVIENARLTLVASTHRSLQTKFAVIQKWLAGNSEDFETDFQQLTGHTLASLTGDKPATPDTLEGLKRTALYLATALKSTVDQDVQAFRAEKSGERVDVLLSNLQNKTDLLIKELVRQLSDPALVERAGKEPLIRADVTRGFDASIDAALKELKIDPASELGRQAKADAAAIRKGLEANIVARYVYKGETTESFPSLARELLTSFRALAEARKVRGELIAHVQKEIKALADTLTHSKGMPDEKQLARNKTLKTLLQTLTEDDRNVGVEATLTLGTLRAMAKTGVLGGMSVDNMAKVLTQGTRSVSLAEDAIRKSRPIAVDADLGAAPEAPAPNAQLDDRLVDSNAPLEDPRSQPAFDRIINANY